MLLATAPPRGWTTQFSSAVVPRILRTIGGHLSLLFWPAELLPRYILPAPTFADPRCYLGLAALVALGFVAAFPRFRRHPVGKGALFAALAFAPVSGLFPNPRDMVDSYLYLPLAGLVVLVGFGAESLARWARTRGASVGRAAAVLAVCALPLALLPASLNQSTIWRDGPTMWAYMLSHYADSPQVCRGFGNALYLRSDFAAAAKVYATCGAAMGRPEFFRHNQEEAMRRAREQAGAATQGR